MHAWTVDVVTNKMGGMCVGICLESAAAAQKFLRSNKWYTTGNGHYAKFAGGLAISHSDSDVNHNFRGFSFGLGDVIGAAFNLNKKSLVFTKNKGESF